MLAPFFRGVAQFGSAFGSGPKGRRFKSCHLDHHRRGRPVVRGGFFYLGPLSRILPRLLPKSNPPCWAFLRPSSGFSFSNVPICYLAFSSALGAPAPPPCRSCALALTGGDSRFRIAAGAVPGSRGRRPSFPPSAGLRAIPADMRPAHPWQTNILWRRAA